MSTPTVTVIPAYGRNYATQAEVMEAWNSDKDFQIVASMPIVRGTYINRQDRPIELEVRIRYANKTELVVLGNNSLEPTAGTESDKPDEGDVLDYLDC